MESDAGSFEDHGALTIKSTEDESGDALVEYQSFLTPPALYLVGADGRLPRLLKSQAPAFDGTKFEVAQYWATSADGTRVPYFVVMAKGLVRDGRAPTWMFSYGGFENSLTPSYSGSYEELHGAYGKLWLERGGVFVLANIRGGGEFGPAWHTSVLKENHYKCFEDFEAVARDLAARKSLRLRTSGSRVAATVDCWWRRRWSGTLNFMAPWCAVIRWSICSGIPNF